ncbi:hypothetical protein [Streptomyces sp. MH60]|uniref:hypothetical protein n=1 Tax=Streptomyces sp. MH60 TaxID=1940758 RepID=UPI000CEE7B71|nr:hypothetical protein [Streptomyces sp. MH60]PPS89597.1 hypothetical protein BZZ08_01744 [Streptomyces sp. MH60]
MTTTTRRPLRKSDVSRMIGRILGKQHRSAAHGWDVIDEGTGPVITLNYGDNDRDLDAYRKIATALDGRYTLTYTATCADYSYLPDDYAYCAMADIRRTPAPAAQEETPVPDTTPTVSITLPAPFCAWFDGTSLALGHDDADPDCKALRLAYEAAATRKTAQGRSAKIITSNPDILKTITEYAETLADAAYDDANDETAGADQTAAAQRDLDAAHTVKQRATTARRELRAALTAHQAQQAPQQPATAAQETEEPADDDTHTPRTITAPVVAHVEWSETVAGHHNGTMTFPNGATYKVTHIEHATPARGALADHVAHDPTADAGPARRVARTWGLDALAADCARHAGYTGPVTIEQTGAHRLTRR